MDTVLASGYKEWIEDKNYCLTKDYTINTVGAHEEIHIFEETRLSVFDSELPTWNETQRAHDEIFTIPEDNTSSLGGATEIILE